MAIGNAIGTPFKSGGAWNPSIPLSGETPTIWSTDRSGSYLQDAEDNNIAEIHTAHPISSIKYYADSGYCDIGATNFTLAIWLEDTSVTDAQREVFGKRTDGTSPQGAFGLFAFTNGFLYAQAKTDGTSISIATPNKFRTYGKCLVIFEIDKDTHKARLFINNNQIGADADWTGSFPALDVKYELVLGAANNFAGTGVINAWTGSYSDAYIFRKILSTAEKTTLLNRGIVTGSIVHYPCLYPYDNYDASGNGKTLTASGAQTYLWSTLGSKQSLMAGFDWYYKAGADKYDVPYLDDGTTPMVASVATYAKYGSYAGSATSHNGARSKFLFSNAFFDRSNDTIYSAEARRAYTDVSYLYRYYDSTQPKLWDILELKQEAFELFFNPDYQNRLFVNGNFNPYDTNKTLRELLLYATKKTGGNLIKLQKYVKIPYRAAGCAMIFDDLGRIASWNAYMEELKFTYGCKASFAINAADEATLTEQSASLLKLRGWNHCLANHTVNHIVWDEYLETHTVQEFYDNEVVPLQGWMNTLLDAYPVVFAYANTGGHNDDLNALLLANGFEFIRPGIYGGVAPVPPQSMYDGSAQFVETSTEGALSETDYSDFYALIDYAYSNNVVFLMLLHTIAETDGGTATTIAIARLKAYLAYIVSKNMKFYRFDELDASLFA